jgi:hypothetical protein
MRTNTLNRSDPWTTMDAAHGVGWYFTDLGPDTCDAWTLAYCWRRLDIFTRVEANLKFYIPDEIVTHCRDHAYILKTWDNRIKYLEGNRNRKCPKAVSCLLYETITRVRRFLGLT